MVVVLVHLLKRTQVHVIVSMKEYGQRVIRYFHFSKDTGYPCVNPKYTVFKCWSIALFSIVTYYPNTWWLKTNLLFYNSIDQKSATGLNGLNSRCQQGYIPFWKLLRWICFLAFSHFYRLPTFFSSLPSFSVFQSSHVASS